MTNAEVLIIGCGIAGATAALRLARNPERQITIITRASEIRESNTRYAQGGIIGRGPDDTSQLLFEDIIAAGAGVTSPEAARILADEGPSLLNEVLERTAGVAFDHTDDGAPIWGQEAAHSRRRILHVGDSTGLAIMNGLARTLGDYPNIKIKTDATAVDLITFPHHSRNPLDNYREISCHGCYVFDRNEKTVQDLSEHYESHGCTRRWVGHGSSSRSTDRQR
jgi:L-aspartate oxidase